MQLNKCTWTINSKSSNVFNLRERIYILRFYDIETKKYQHFVIIFECAQQAYFLFINVTYDNLLNVRMK